MFIQIIQGPSTHQARLHQLIDEWCHDMAERPGWLGGTFGFTDDGTLHGVVRFESETACRQNASRSASALWWAAAIELLDGPPEVHESGDVTMLMDGGSDDAGFVQIIQGRVIDAERLRRTVQDGDMVSMLHRARPEIIGATLAIEPDGTFTETVAFTSEHAAREGETERMPTDVRTEYEGAMTQTRFVDLRQPWFASRWG